MLTVLGCPSSSEKANTQAEIPDCVCAEFLFYLEVRKWADRAELRWRLLEPGLPPSHHAISGIDFILLAPEMNAYVLGKKTESGESSQTMCSTLL